MNVYIRYFYWFASHNDALQHVKGGKFSCAGICRTRGELTGTTAVCRFEIDFQPGAGIIGFRLVAGPLYFY